jgi:hypothetical protein
LRTIRPALAAAIALAVAVGGSPARAASALDGAAMSWPWALPFAGILLSIAAGPLLFRRVWLDHYGKVAAGWAALTLAAIALATGPSAAAHRAPAAALGLRGRKPVPVIRSRCRCRPEAR